MRSGIRCVPLFLVFIALFTGIVSIERPAAAQNECANAPRPRLIVGERGRVLPGDPNNLRDQPSSSGVRVGTLPGGTGFAVLEGPVCAEGFNWWRVEGDNGVTGWTVEGADGVRWVEPVAPDAPTPLPEPEMIRGECPYTTGRIVFGTVRQVVRADGETIYGRLITTDPDGGNACLLTEMIASPSYTEEVLSDPVWSPDGTQIVFKLAASQDWQDGASVIYLINADGSNLRPLTAFGDNFTHISWSPDSERVAYITMFDGWVGFADGRGSRPLFDNLGQLQALAWSPDGQWLALAAYAGSSEFGSDIFLLSPDGGDPILIARTGPVVRDLVWAPNSRSLLFSADGIHELPIPEDVANITPQLFTMRAANTWTAPAFSPGGALMAFWHGGLRDEIRSQLKLIDVDWDNDSMLAEPSAGQQPVNGYRILVAQVDQPLPDGFSALHSPSWSPDGRSLVYATAEGVYTVDVETGELAAIWTGEINGAPQFQPPTPTD